MISRERAWRCVLTVAIALAAFQSGAARSQDARVLGLQTGTVTERHRVLIQLLGRPSGARSASEWNALIAELQRVHAQVQTFLHLTGNDLAEIGLTSDDASRLSAYYSDLAAAVGQSKSATVVQLLIECVDAGPPGQYAVAKFGDVAVDGLLVTARSLRDYEHVTAALETLATMYDAELAPLSMLSQQSIVTYLREAWIPSPLKVPIVALANLSLVTGDQQLRAIVARLASDPSMVAARIAGSSWHSDLVLEDLKALLRPRIRPLVSDVAALRGGNEGQIESALSRILPTPPGDRSPAVWEAVADAFVRRQRQPRSSAGGSDPEDEVGSEFVQILTQSRDPIVIPALVVALRNAGWPAWDALARFGDRSIGPLLGVARKGSRGNRPGAIRSLAWLMEHETDDPVFPLSPRGRQRIVSFAREAWRRPRVR